MDFAKVIGITGLSCAGKTSIGKALYKLWKPVEPALVLLDGDEMRNLFAFERGYSLEDRLKLVPLNVNLCKMLSEQGINVIVCTISLHDDTRKLRYANFKNYSEIFLSVPMDILKQRDKKGLYNGATVNVVGVDIDADYPENPEMMIINDGTQTPNEIAGQIIEQLGLLKG